jgi:hypothetical protein
MDLNETVAKIIHQARWERLLGPGKASELPQILNPNILSATDPPGV